MQISNTLYVVNRDEWRKWLEKNYKTEPDIWLIFYKKSSGKPRISYNDAVEEALCFGWIDSIVKSIDNEKFAQRFSPRKNNKYFSRPNIERLNKLISQGKMQPEVLANLPDFPKIVFKIAPDILGAIKADKSAWENFNKFSDDYKRIRISYIEDARSRPDMFKKRLNNFIKMTAKNKQFGFGGVEKYY